eukprot:165007-Alexandrium_andersonii.AAC.1
MPTSHCFGSTGSVCAPDRAPCAPCSWRRRPPCNSRLAYLAVGESPRPHHCVQGDVAHIAPWHARAPCSARCTPS